MKRFWKRFVVTPIAQTRADTSWFGFVVSVVVVAVVINLSSALIIESFGRAASLLTMGGLLLFVLLFAYAYTWQQKRSVHGQPRPISDAKRPPEPKRGLILMVSNEQTAKVALHHHRPRLEHLWLVVTPQKMEEAARIKQQAQADGIHCHLLELSEEYNVRACYRLVSRVYQFEVDDYQLAPADVIADITGGTKPMTAAMVMACIDQNQTRLQHVPARFLGEEPIEAYLPIEIAFGAPHPESNLRIHEPAH